MCTFEKNELKVVNKLAPRLFLGLTLVIIILYISLIPFPRADNHLLSSDAVYYYSYMRTIILDRDLDITNDISFYNSRIRPNNPARVGVSYSFSIGPALLWSPFFIASHFLALILSKIGIPIPTDGYSYLEEATICLSSILYAIVGLLLLFRVAQRFFSASASLISVFVVFLASSAFYYVLFEPSMSHSLEVFTVALFVWLLFCFPGESERGYWFLTGFSAGLMSIVRWQNGVFVPLLLYKLINSQDKSNKPLSILKQLSFTLLGLVLVISLQLLFWKHTIGSFIAIPQGKGFLKLTQPHILEVLFSTRHGLFLWTPITLLAILGLLFFRERILASFLFTTFFLDLYISSIALDWWAGHAFGMRRLIGATPIFVLGLAAFLDHFKISKIKNKILFFLIFLIGWNFLFIIQYRLGLIPHGDYLTFNQMITDKFILPLKILKFKI